LIVELKVTAQTTNLQDLMNAINASHKTGLKAWWGQRTCIPVTHCWGCAAVLIDVRAWLFQPTFVFIAILIFYYHNYYYNCGLVNQTCVCHTTSLLMIVNSEPRVIVVSILMPLSRSGAFNKSCSLASGCRPRALCHPPNSDLDITGGQTIF